MSITTAKQSDNRGKERPKLMVIEQIPIAKIRVPEGRRHLRDLAGLMQSIEEVGLQNPISVSTDKTLVAGYHRLEACRGLGHETIAAQILTLDRLRLELVEIEENLVRAELDGIERGEALKRQKEIYEALHPETRHGFSGGSASAESQRDRKGTDADAASVEDCDSTTKAEPPLSFAKYAAQKTGRAERTVQEDIRIASKLTDDVKDKLRGTELANRQNVLQSLAMLSPEEQMAKVDRVLSGASTPKEEGLGVINRSAPGEGRTVSTKGRDRTSVVLPDEPREAVRVLRRYFSADELREMALWILGEDDVQKVMFAVQKRFGRTSMEHAFRVNSGRRSVPDRSEESEHATV